jgi:hypothetical protein
MNENQENALTLCLALAVIAALIAVWTMAAPIASKAALTAFVFGAIAGGVYYFGRNG